MINTPTLPTLTLVSSRALPLDDRARQWIQDLEQKGQNRRYLRDPDFQPSYHSGYQTCQECLKEGEYEPTLEVVISDIEYSLSHPIYEKQKRLSETQGLPYHSYPHQVGFLFGWLTALLQTDAATDLPFLLAPVADMHSCLAAVTQGAPDCPRTFARCTGGDGFPLDL